MTSPPVPPARRSACPRHPDHPCTCGMGHLYRFVEPVILFLLSEKGEAHGYELAGALPAHALTDAPIETAALYRTLRALESHGHVVSKWDVSGGGPARRIYQLAPSGEQHLRDWLVILDQMSRSMNAFVQRAHGVLGEAPRQPEGAARRRRDSPGDEPE